MARFDPADRPRGYHPRQVLDLREDDEGGAVRPQVVVRWRGIPGTAGPELLLLIHGFNNHRAEAESAYAVFRQRQQSTCRGPVGQALDDWAADVFWPGDAKAPGFLDVADALCYPGALVAARDEVVPRLAEHLRRAEGGVHRLHLVGHSMGARIALELIQQLQREGGPAIGRVVLMAAAVPTFMLQPGGRLEHATLWAEAVQVLCSRSDRVLQLAFPVGQSAAKGDEGFMPEALGRRGHVPATAGGRVTRIEVPRAGHGDYWGWIDQRDGHFIDGAAQAANSAAADAVAQFFDRGIAPQGVARREVGSINETPARLVAAPA